MSIRRKLSVFVGLAQCLIGALTPIFAYILYHNFFGIQNALNVSQKDVLLYLLILIVFGLLSIISGLFLVNEKQIGD